MGFVFRAVVPTQSNVIEAGPNMMRESEEEWHYNCSGERKGPVSFQEVRYVHVCEIFCSEGWAKLLTPLLPSSATKLPFANVQIAWG